jgi:hypothetical protein
MYCFYQPLHSIRAVALLAMALLRCKVGKKLRYILHSMAAGLNIKQTKK